MSIFDGAIFDSAIFDTGDDAPGPTGFLPRGSVASVTMPDLASASVTVPGYSVSVTVPDYNAEVE